MISRDSKGDAGFKGCLLEGINGKSLDKRLQDDASFCDVDFILLMLGQVGKGVMLMLETAFAGMNGCINACTNACVNAASSVGEVVGA